MNQPPLLSSVERNIYSVTRLNREAKALLEDRFPLLWVEGELSNLSRPASGHLYFSLKDAHAQVRCALFRGNQKTLSAPPKDGMQVLVRARVSLYEGRGDYQLIVESVEEAGEGALRRAFDMLKNRLAHEGLFDGTHKKPLPRLPKRIGLITSLSGAVLHDILTTLKRRFPTIPVMLYPVPVQGDGAAEKIAAMLKLAGQRLDCDVLILARGGGSLEDLWAFNEEIVARAIYACPIPVVCGVGHETDFTIADFVADARAATPTAAAEMLSPNQSDWLASLDDLERRLRRQLRDHLLNTQQKLDYLNARLLRHNPQALLREQRLRNQHLRLQFTTAIRRLLERAHERLARAAQALDTLSPLATLARGYAIIEQPSNGTVVRRAAQLRPGDAIRARLAQGVLDCRVEKVHKND